MSDEENVFPLEEREALYAIAREVAAMDPYTYNDASGMDECVFCSDSYGWGSDVKNTRDHEDDCTYLKACHLIKGVSSESESGRVKIEHRRLGLTPVSDTLVWEMLGVPHGTTPIDGEVLFKKLCLPDEYLFIRCDALPDMRCFTLLITHPHFPEVACEQDATPFQFIYHQRDGATVMVGHVLM